MHTFFRTAGSHFQPPEPFKVLPLRTFCPCLGDCDTLGGTQDPGWPCTSSTLGRETFFPAGTLCLHPAADKSCTSRPSHHPARAPHAAVAAQTCQMLPSYPLSNALGPAGVCAAVVDMIERHTPTKLALRPSGCVCTPLPLGFAWRGHLRLGLVSGCGVCVVGRGRNGVEGVIWW